jgi:hypothetical protein
VNCAVVTSAVSRPVTRRWKPCCFLAKVSEEANESAEKYRRSRGWGTNCVTSASQTEVYDEVCATIMAGLVALDRICPDASAHRERYLAHGYERAARENANAAADS